MIGPRIVQAFAVGNQNTEQRAQLQQLMPIAVVPRQSRRVQAHDKPSFAKSDFGNQRLEAVPIPAGGSRLAQIVVDDMNPLAWPTEQCSPLDQPILQLSALLVMANLPRR